MATTLESSNNATTLSVREQAVVDDFTAVIRRHQGQGPGALARLASRAFDRTIASSKSHQGKLALAMARGLEARQQLADAEGGSLSSDEVARLLGISKTAALKRLEAGKLLAWRQERLQAARFPQWQFDEYGQVLAGFPEVLKCLNANKHLDAWAKVLFFLQNKSSLRGKRPLDLLRKGRVKDVCLAARAYAE